MSTLRELKGRIGSVASSEKITGAMKMISSAKMHKAEGALRKQLPYRRQIETVIGNLLTADAPFSSPLIESREVQNIAIVIWGSDDGLCGAYNINLYKQLQERISELRGKYGEDVELTIIPVGGKMAKAVSKLAGIKTVVSPVEGIDSKTEGEAVKSFLVLLQDGFLAGKYDLVELLYMHFKSVAKQVPAFEQLLPADAANFRKADGKVIQSRPYIFEPDVTTIFRAILPLYMLSVMTEVFTENRASEQAARVMAMQSANDNAKKLLEQLRLEYNKLRQQSITTELLDILGGQVR
ncbi:MAG: ATP synthase F1 subunit gamma [Muribaculaceae bacterium]